MLFYHVSRIPSQSMWMSGDVLSSAVLIILDWTNVLTNEYWNIIFITDPNALTIANEAECKEG